MLLQYDTCVTDTISQHTHARLKKVLLNQDSSGHNLTTHTKQCRRDCMKCCWTKPRWRSVEHNNNEEWNTTKSNRPKGSIHHKIYSSLQDDLNFFPSCSVSESRCLLYWHPSSLDPSSDASDWNSDEDLERENWLQLRGCYTEVYDPDPERECDKGGPNRCKNASLKQRNWGSRQPKRRVRDDVTPAASQCDTVWRSNEKQWRSNEKQWHNNERRKLPRRLHKAIRSF